MPVANPLLSTVATEVASELQVKITPLMTFPLESLATAVNCCLCPAMMVIVAGDTVTLATAPGARVLELVDSPQPDRKTAHNSGMSIHIVALSVKSIELSARSTLEPLRPLVSASRDCGPPK